MTKMPRRDRLVSIDKNNAAQVANAHTLIDLMYRVERRGRRKPKVNGRNNRRFAELQLVLMFNHYPGGPPLSDDDAGEDDLNIAIHHLIKLGKKPIRLVHAWAAQWAPWCSRERLDSFIEMAIANPRSWDADELAAALGLTYAVRTGLGITTIGAVDKTKKERAAIQRKADVHRKREKRRASGAVPREQWLAGHSQEREKPWSAAGVSRSTWKRRQRKQRLLDETGATDAILNARLHESRDPAALQAEQPQRARDAEEWKCLAIAAAECNYTYEQMRRLCVKHHQMPPSERGFQCKRDGRSWLVELNSALIFARRKWRRKR